jgi:hypothetical protein
MKLTFPIVRPAWVAGLKVIASKCEICDRSLALRQISNRKVGIKMRDFWYCSSRCFTSAAEQQVSRLLQLRTEQAAPRMPLGLDLISRGLLTVEQLKKATDEQKETGGEIGELLVRHGVVSEKQVTAIRAAEWGCPVFAVPKQVVRITIDIPAALMRIYSMTPVHYVPATNLLLVGFVHSIEYGLLYSIEQISGCKTKPCFVTPSDFQSQMFHQEKEQEQDGNAPGTEAKIRSAKTPDEIARLLCASSLEIEADEALIERCKEYLWARLKSGSKVVDLLFKTK